VYARGAQAKPNQLAIETALRSQKFSYTPNEFEAFSLCKPLDALCVDSPCRRDDLGVSPHSMADRFLDVYDYRCQQPKLNWAGAEHATSPRQKISSQEVDKAACREADRQEKQLEGVRLPEDPLRSGSAAEQVKVSVPLVAMSYLIRRFILCPRFCTVRLASAQSPVSSRAERMQICHAPVEHVA
jgi:ubiquitin-conjugating enzyme E2 Q